MKWRCAWCEKPHEANDPPCDNCGHGEFEKAVVPVAPESETDDGDTYYAWICTECGNDHPKHTPPCDRCGNADLERRELQFDEEEVVSEMLGEGRSGPSADVSYLDVLDAKLVGMFVGVGALVLVLGLGALGVIHVPGISPSPVPGHADSVDGLDLSAVEGAFVDQLNERRDSAGLDPVSVDDRLADAARYANQERVRQRYADGNGATREGVRERLGDACGGYAPPKIYPPISTSLGQNGDAAFENESALGRSLVSRFYGSDGATVAPQRENLVGVDVHVAPDGTVFVVEITC